MKKNLIFAQSGGPTSVINASAYGIIKEAKKHGIKVYAARHGVMGILKDDIIDLTDISENELETLRYSPSAAFGSCRYKLKDGDFEKIVNIFDKHNIGYFLYIGGNDSMDTSNRFSSYAKKIGKDIKVIGVPKTIDNDLTNTHFCPGYGSAAKFIASSVRGMGLDAAVYGREQVTIVEAMGRDSGFLAAASALAKDDKTDCPHLIYLPEILFNEDEFLNDIETALTKQNSVFIVISEGIRDKDGNYIHLETKADSFGNVQMGGACSRLEHIVKENLKVRIRSIELSTTQRCAAYIASLVDNEVAVMVGKTGVNYAMNGISDVMVSIENTDEGFTTNKVPLAKVANVIKQFPKEWIDVKNRWVTQEAIDYMLPLIQGQVDVPYVNGLPKYTKFY